MSVEALEDSAMRFVVDHLRLPIEVSQTGGCTELQRHRLHKGRRISVSSLVPIMIGPIVANRPLIFLGQKGLKGFQSRRRSYSNFHCEALRQLGEVVFRFLIFVWPAVVEIDLIRVSRVIPRPILIVDKLGQSAVDGRWRYTFIAAAPDCDRRVVAIAMDRVLRILEEEAGVVRLEVD